MNPQLSALIGQGIAQGTGYHLGSTGMINKPGGPGANLADEATGEDVSWPNAIVKHMFIPGYMGYRLGRKNLARQMLDRKQVGQ